VRFISPAAEAGYAMAQRNLGLAFEYGEGVKANQVEAVKWLQKGILLSILQSINTLSALLSPAAEAGILEAQEHVISVIQNWREVKKIPTKALQWYQRGMLSQLLQNISTLSAILRQE
jgi:TPR repeat protein